MILDALIFLGTIFAIIAVVACIYYFVKAPEGVEGESGFHVVESEQPASSRYFAVQAKELRRTKSYKAHLPVS